MSTSRLFIKTTFLEMFVGSFTCLSKQKPPMHITLDAKDVIPTPIPSVRDLLHPTQFWSQKNNVDIYKLYSKHISILFQHHGQKKDKIS